MADWIVIGISGVTCGGKTTLANKLRSTLVPVYVFNQDRYFYPDDSPNHIKCDNIEHNNYDILSALDMNAMYNDVVDTMNGDTRAHSMNEEEGRGKLRVQGKKFLILEGFTVLNFKPIMEICNYRYYFTLEYGECFARRALRLYEPPDVAGYFEECVWPHHVLYRRQMENDNRVTFIEGTRPDALDVVLDDLKKNGASEVGR